LCSVCFTLAALCCLCLGCIIRCCRWHRHRRCGDDSREVGLGHGGGIELAQAEDDRYRQALSLGASRRQDAEHARTSAQVESLLIETYTITIDRSVGCFDHELRERVLKQPLGMTLSIMDEHLQVDAIEAGLVSQWNTEHLGPGPDVKVRPGHRILQVNAVLGSGKRMFEELSRCQTVVVTLTREVRRPRLQGNAQVSFRQSIESWVKEAAGSAKHRVSSFVARRIALMQDPAKQRRLSDLLRIQKVQAENVRPLVSLYAKPAGPGKWVLEGVYTYQALKVGLRYLNQIWDGVDLNVFKHGRYVLQRRLLLSLVNGTHKLNSTPVADVSASQRDVRCLTVAQLVRLKVLHLDVDMKTETHKAFMTIVDDCMFQELGEVVTKDISGLGDEGKNLYGVQALQLAAAATAVQAPTAWTWWLGDDRRVVFQPALFAFSELEEFPSGGVLEVSDYSKKDTSTGLCCMDWQIRHVTKAEDLQTVEQHARSSCKLTLGDIISEEVLSNSLQKLRRWRTGIPEDTERDPAVQQIII